MLIIITVIIIILIIIIFIIMAAWSASSEVLLSRALCKINLALKFESKTKRGLRRLKIAVKYPKRVKID